MKGFHAQKTRLPLICAVCTALVLAAYIVALSGKRFGTLLGWEMRFRNLLVIKGRSNPPDSRLLALAIDNTSVTLEGVDLDELFADVPRGSTDYKALSLIARQFPFPRETYALILDKLFAAGARVVVFDLMFPKSTPDDPPFRAALDRYAGRVIIGSNFTPPTTTGGGATEQTVPADSVVPQTTPLDPRVAYVNFWPDDVDGIVRRASLRLTLESLRPDFPSTPESEVFVSLAARAVSDAGFPNLVPAGQNVDRLFRYSGPPGAGFPPIPVYQLFVPRYWEANLGGGEKVRGKIVVIGPYGNWAHDEHETPFGKMAGPELHLNAINALLHQAFLSEAPPWLDYLLIIGSGILAWLVALLARPILQVLMGLALTAAVIFGALALYNYADLFVATISPLLALHLSGSSCLVYQFFREQVEKARTRRTLERYVSKDVVRELLDNRESLLNSLGGARKPITVLFSDLRGFTSLTESADAVMLVTQLNEYFNHMVRLVFANSGTLDKFIGDGIMSHWGSIVTAGEKGDACNAVRTALQMRSGLAKLNEEWKPRGFVELKFGIGINSGDAIVGNLGCEEKMEVSAIGDAVNLAARIEGATKEFHVDLLIGAQVATLVRESFLLRSVELLQVKGKTKPVAVFTVIDERNGALEPEWLVRYEEGVRLYRTREFAAAAACFSTAVELRPGDWLNDEYLRRAQKHAAQAPEPEWSGVFVMENK